MNLVFEAPTAKNLKFLRLYLPSAAFQANGPMVYYEISQGYIPAPADKVDQAGKSGDNNGS